MDRYNLSYLEENWRRVLELTVDHLVLTGLAIGLALLVALPLGVFAARARRLTLPILFMLSALYTIPSLAFLAFLIPSLGLGRDNALVVLATYAQIFLVRNLIAGLRGVDPATVEAAAGLGMTRWQVFAKVRWPLALPVITAGLRIAMVTTISLATIAAWVGAGGLGELLFEGLSLNRPPRILAGAMTITVLAIMVDLAFRVPEYLFAASRARRAARPSSVASTRPAP